MTFYEKKIIDHFIERFIDRFPAPDKGSSLRLRSAAIFPDFDTAPPDEKESYLEAAEALERRGLLTLTWEKRGRGERLKTLYCPDREKLFEASGRRDPRNEAEEIRRLIRERLPGIGIQSQVVRPFLDYLVANYSPADAGRGMDRAAAEDFLRLLETLAAGDQGSLTTRALSVKLYHDSKRLERLLDLASPLTARARKQGIPVPDLAPLERSFPETLIAGKLIFEYLDGAPPLINSSGAILGFPAESVRALSRIAPIDRDGDAPPAVLTIENKETFYALATPRGPPVSGCVCRLYTGGYPNEAAAALIRLLAASGFRFFHAGDLDPDGILILQNIEDLAAQTVKAVQMDAAAFDRWLPWSRPLPQPILRRLTKIRQDLRTRPSLASLIRRIEETGRGIEQEIIDYRE